MNDALSLDDDDIVETGITNVGRPRANSMPAISRNKEFYETFRAVMTHGILSRSEMNKRHISFNNSHDPKSLVRHDIDVTRVHGGMDKKLEDTRATSIRAVTNHSHGALTVSLERGDTELSLRAQTNMEVLHSMPLAQKHALMQKNPNMAISTIDHLRSGVPTQQGKQEAVERMHATFLVTSPAYTNPHNYSSAYEAKRPSIKPSQMGIVGVPHEHMTTAKQVLRDLNVRSHTPFPTLSSVHSTQHLSPQYIAKKPPHGANSRVNVHGLSAPAYHHTVTSQLHSGHTDIHLVKTGIGAGQGARKVARPRSRTF